MKYHLIISLSLIPFFSFSQIEFTGYIQDSRSHKPIANAQIAVKGSDVSAENALTTDASGFFIIKFENKSLNRSFQLTISHKDFFSTDHSEVVMSTRKPKTYYLKPKAAPPTTTKRPAETTQKRVPAQETKQQKVNTETNPQAPVDNKVDEKKKIEKPNAPATPDANDYPSLNRDPLNKTGNRYLTETDKKILKEQLTDHTKKAFVRFQRGNKEALAYAYEILAYTKLLGFTGTIQYYQPLAEGRFDIAPLNKMYNVNVLVRLPE